MKIDISDIIKANGNFKELSFEEKIGSIQSPYNGFSFDDPLKFKGKITNTSGIMILDGVLEVPYVCKCYRCLKSITDSFKISILEEFRTAEDTSEENYLYSGYILDIDKALLDNLLLELPMKQVCAENCKGLCGKCGVNLNHNDCKCSDDELNPKFQVLKDFFKA